jgi:3-oxoacyl-[acyl-carrier protein] reductase
MAGKLDGKVAIVTGAARGIGRAHARHLAQLGARVAVTDVNLRSYEEFAGEARSMTAASTVDEINAAGGEAIGLEFDVGDRAAVFDMAETVRRTWGRIDVLVTNAGGGRGTPAQTAASIVPADLLETVVRLNLYGTIYCCGAVAPVMKEQCSGRIITVASYQGLVAGLGGGYAHYGAAKAAIIHYTRHLAQELGPFGINANCIAPGAILTGRIATWVEADAKLAETSLRDIPLHRFGTVEDCAKVVEFLATDLSDYVTGAVIPIDGGWNKAG